MGDSSGGWSSFSPRAYHPTRKDSEVFRSRWNNLIGITRGFGGPVNGP